MNKFKLPVLLPPGVRPYMTQPFGATANTLEPKGPHGEPHYHYGIDLVFGNAINTFGTPIVSPFVNGSMIAYFRDTGNASVTPFIELEGRGVSGNDYKIVLAHVSTIIVRDPMHEGDIVGTVGNYGLVSPKPTPADPFAGSHIHLELLVNGVQTDPLEYFDLTQFYVGSQHDPLSDVPRIVWAIERLSAQLADLKAKLP